MNIKKILVINAGSSSLKYQLIDMTDEKVLQKATARESAQTVHLSDLKAPTAKN
jgi:acetate kinase